MTLIGSGREGIGAVADTAALIAAQELSPVRALQLNAAKEGEQYDSLGPGIHRQFR